ncbi:hypothetical protein HXX76_001880 [Chlamydomonas incerta]|uniref:Leucine-rich repeat-containing N-terminal plant-type domain-containing protein n=1 Tax=Chlamydomonas incerta TaxID=51695 RepID=A0A835TEA3_CHLIN|nr:hypothetical protein HXX76_001880 [Chlamydomonas incerta]|eukprot:KAG2443528.1 hypothetical protein HXX76_001880 [Chlamydomonas incerta]
MTQLEYVSVASNGAGLGGVLPVSWSALTRLTELDLSGNGFYSTIPAAWAGPGGMGVLQYLWLGNNGALCGSIPAPWAAGSPVMSGGTQLGLACPSPPSPPPVPPSPAPPSPAPPSPAPPSPPPPSFGYALADLRVTASPLPAAILGWNTSSDPCTASWTGVSCTAGQPTTVVLNQRSLTGSLPDSWAYVSSLSTIRATNNSLTGTLPRSWSALASLTRLELLGNRYSGQLPAEWSTLTNLRTLDLGGNLLTGPVPAAWSVLTGLFRVDVSGNSLIPAPPAPPTAANALLQVKYELGNSTALSTWDDVLHPNPCTSWYGVSCDGSGNVVDLSLPATSPRLAGPLPPSLVQVRTLRSVTLSGNALTGTLPDSYSQMTQLEYVSVASNGAGLGGVLPVSWSALTRLTELDLSGNGFYSTIPAAWAGPGGMGVLQYLWLGNNGALCGSIPAPWAAGSPVMSSGTQLGLACPSPPSPPPVPPSPAPPSPAPPSPAPPSPPPPSFGYALADLRVTASPLPAAILGWNTSSDPCTASWTGVSCTAGQPTTVVLNQRSLTGSLPDSWAYVSSLSTIRATNNSLTGTLPRSWSALASLTRLELLGNRYSGQLPAEWSTLTNLRTLDLGGNLLTGPVPAAWSVLTGLFRVDVSGNSLIPVPPSPLPPSPAPPSPAPPAPPTAANALLQVKYELGNSTALSTWDDVLHPNPCTSWYGVSCDGSGNVVDLSLPATSPRLAGPLPPSLVQVRTLRSVTLSGNALTGTLPDSYSQMTQLEYVSVASNGAGLGGMLPVSWSALTRLTELDLSGNGFYSTIPAAWAGPGGMGVLQYLWLGNNGALCGSIPAPWAAGSPAMSGGTQLGLACPSPPSPPPVPPSPAPPSPAPPSPAPPSPPPPSFGYALADLRVTASPLPAAILGWNTSSDPCTASWTGVSCTAGQPTTVVLNQRSLTGSLPDSWAYVSSLSTIRATNNSLTGTLPRSWSALASLTRLELLGNRYSGQLPAEWSTLTNLRTLDLGGNLLTGPVPAAWSVLTGLFRVDVSGNSLMCGPVPSASVYVYNGTQIPATCPSPPPPPTPPSPPPSPAPPSPEPPSPAPPVPPSPAPPLPPSPAPPSPAPPSPAPPSPPSPVPPVPPSPAPPSPAPPSPDPPSPAPPSPEPPAPSPPPSPAPPSPAPPSPAPPVPPSPAPPSPEPPVPPSPAPPSPAPPSPVPPSPLPPSPAPPSPAPPAPPTAANALLQVKYELGNSTALSTWDDVLHPNPCTSWYGVSCDGSGNVVDLSLPATSPRLAGPLPPSLVQVRTLRSVTLSGNALTGTLPDSYSQMTQLEYVSVASNGAGLGGVLPVSWSALTRLTELDLSGNGFYSTIPAAWAGPGGMGVLQYLWLGNNGALCGSIPAPWAAGSPVMSGGTQLGLACPSPPSPPPVPPSPAPPSPAPPSPAPPSPPPPSFGYALADLRVTASPLPAAILGWNTSSDPCTASWTGVSCTAGQPTTVVLNQRSLTGSLPDSWAYVSSLSTIRATNNSLTGTLPRSWSALASLTRLELLGNRYSGQLPAEWSTLTNLRTLDLGGNLLTGPVPAAWSVLTGLFRVDVSGNSLMCGPVPSASVYVYNGTQIPATCPSPPPPPTPPSPPPSPAPPSPEPPSPAPPVPPSPAPPLPPSPAPPSPAPPSPAPPSPPSPAPPVPPSPAPPSPAPPSPDPPSPAPPSPEPPAPSPPPSPAPPSPAPPSPEPPVPPSPAPPSPAPPSPVPPSPLPPSPAPPSPAPPAPPTAANALLQVKYELGNSTALSTWDDVLHPNPCTSWYGVSCDGSGNVVDLSLPATSPRLAGPLPPSLVQVRTLRSVTLSGNALTGTLPDSYSQMTQLEYVSVASNGAGLGGVLPVSWSALTRLTELDLSGNGFYSTIPAAWAGPGGMGVLQYLWLGNNGALCGSIPAPWAAGSPVMSSGTQLGLACPSPPSPPPVPPSPAPPSPAPPSPAPPSPPPPSFGYALADLRVTASPLPAAILGWNTSSDPCTASWTGVSCTAGQPTTVVLNQRSLTGSLPDSWAYVSSLSTIRATNNSLTGTLPRSWSALASLTRLELLGNRYSGQLPAEWSTLTNLRTLDLGGNLLTGPVPAAWSVLTGLFRVDVSGNSLMCGPVPSASVYVYNGTQIPATCPSPPPPPTPPSPPPSPAPPSPEPPSPAPPVPPSPAPPLPPSPAPPSPAPPSPAPPSPPSPVPPVPPSPAPPSPAPPSPDPPSPAPPSPEPPAPSPPPSPAPPSPAPPSPEPPVPPSPAPPSPAPPSPVPPSPLPPSPAPPSPAPPAPPTAANALLQVKYELGNSTALSTWDDVLHSNPCTSWYGVSCDGSGNVVDLSLPATSPRLAGPLPPSLVQVRTLRSVTLSGNALTGTLPDSYSQMTQLEYVSVASNGAGLGGVLPVSWSALTRLTELDLSGNGFYSTIPAAWAGPGGMGVLQYLWLGNNGALCGSIPAPWAAGSPVMSSGTQLGLACPSPPSPPPVPPSPAPPSPAPPSPAPPSPPPPSFGYALADLRVTASPLPAAILGWNTSSDPCTAAWTGVSCTAGQPTTVVLNQRSLTGSLPDSWAYVSSLSTIRATNNSLTGTLPRSWSALASLTRLELLGNRYSGQLPAEWSTLTNLRTLDLGGNLLTGPVPAAWSVLTGLFRVDVSGNSLMCGPVPSASVYVYNGTQIPATCPSPPPPPTPPSPPPSPAPPSPEPPSPAPPVPPSPAPPLPPSPAPPSPAPPSPDPPSPAPPSPEPPAPSPPPSPAPPSPAPPSPEPPVPPSPAPPSPAPPSPVPPSPLPPSPAPPSPAPPAPPTAANALLQVKYELGNSTALSTWDDVLHPNPCTSWYGVSCDGSGNVVDLSLPATSPRLAGPLPPSLVQVRTLRSVTLSGNALTGTLPDSYSQMTQLEYVSVASNGAGLGGVLPVSWSALTRLTELDLSGNGFYSTIPAAWAGPGGMGVLQYLWLGNNGALCGSIPAPWAAGSPVMSGGTQLGLACPSPPSPPPVPPSPAPPSPAPPSPAPPSPPPPSFGYALADLRVTASPLPAAILGWNTSSDPCTAAWTGVSCTAGQPTTVVLNQRSLTGSLPDSWAYVSSLSTIRATNNSLTGTLPRSWSALASLTRLELLGNRYSGQLPAEWSTLTNLRTLDLGGNLLTGPVPAAWSVLTGLFRVDVSGNSLMCGPVPSASVYVYNGTQIPATCPSPPPPPTPPSPPPSPAPPSPEPPSPAPPVPPSPAPPVPPSPAPPSPAPPSPDPPSPAPPSPEPPAPSPPPSPAPPSPAPPSPEPPVPPSPAPPSPAPPSPVPPSPLPPSPAPPSPAPPAPPTAANALLQVKYELGNSTALSTWDDVLHPNPCTSWYGVSCDGSGNVVDLSLPATSPRLAGPLPPSLVQVRTLRSVTLSGNALTGTLPDSYSQMTQLEYVSVASNGAGLGGVLPVSWSALTRLTELDLSGNGFYSTIPAAWAGPGGMGVLQYLWLGNNGALCGSIPAPWAAGSPVMSGGTQLGLACPSPPSPPPVPPSPAPPSPAPPSPAPPSPPPPSFGYALADLRVTASPLPAAILGWNTSSDPCTAAWTGVSCTAGQPTTVVLNQRSLTGSLPDSWAYVSSLSTIRATNNSLTGTLPRSWSALASLTRLELLGNRYSGQLPAEWSTLTNLRTLDLGGNLLTGPVPAAWSVLTGLFRVDVSGNSLMCGPVPSASVYVYNGTQIPATCPSPPPPPTPPSPPPSPAPPSPEPPSPAPPVPPSPAPPVPPSPAPPSPAPPSPDPPSPAPPSPEPPAPSPPPSPAPPSPAPPSPEPPVPPSPAPPSPAPPSPVPPSPLPPSPAPPSPAPPAPPTAANALLQVKYELGNSTALSTWDDVLHPNPCTSWYGVSCDGSGNVVDLSLPATSPRLAGPLPPSLVQVRTLRSVTLSGNALTGTLPDSYSQMTQLEYVSVASNGAGLGGVLPVSWSALTRLTELDLSGNGFYSTIPAAWAGPGGMGVLQYLWLGNNGALCGSIPAPWAAGSPVMSGGTQLGLACPSPPSPPPVPPSPAPPSPAPPSPAPPSPPPPSFGYALADLRVTASPLPAAILGWNTSSDPCTAAWTGVSCTAGQPTTVVLNQRSLTGSLPDSWAYVSSLSTIRATNNSLTGTLPRSWSALASLTRLELLGNRYSGQLPAEWSTLTNLRTLDLGGNLLTGPVPAAWSVLTGLFRVDVSGNSLMCGPVPSASVYVYNGTQIPATCPSPPPPPTPPSPPPSPAPPSPEPPSPAPPVPPSPAPPVPPSPAPPSPAPPSPDPPSPAPPSPEPPAPSPPPSPAPPSPAPPSPEPPVPPSPAPPSPAPPSPVPPSPLPPSPAPPSPAPPAPPTAANALLQVKYELGNSTALSTWDDVLHPNPCTSWYGVSCDGSGNVVDLSLPATSPRLAGPLPPSLVQVRTLRSVTLSGNALTGTLPDSYSQMTQLEYVSVASNGAGLGGVLPVSWSALTRLTELDLSGNGFYSTIPAAWAGPGGMGVLQYLWLGNNGALCGSIPAPWAAGSPVMSGGTQLGLACPSPPSPPPVPPSPAPPSPAPPSPAPPSPPPPSFGYALADLRVTASPLPAAILGWNTSSDPCTAAWTGVSCTAGQPTTVVLNQRSLTGSLPDSWAYVSSLSTIRATNNSLTGTLPRSWSALASLTRLELLGNRYSGQLPAEWSTLTNLRTLDLGGNLLTGPVPAAWSVLTGLFRVDVSGNSLMCGPVPSASVYVYNGTQIPATCPSPPPPPTPPSPPPSPAPPSPEPPSPDPPSPFPPSPLPPSPPPPPSPAPPSPAPPSPEPPVPPSPVPPSPAPPSPVPPSPLPPSPAPPSPAPPAPPTAANALLQVKYELGNSTALSTWDDVLHPNPCTSWYGVSCDGSGNVVDLSLPATSPRLAGPLPPSLVQVRTLKSIDLSGNALTGMLPDSYSQMTQLEAASVASNLLSGLLPVSWSELRSLRSLDIGTNPQLASTIPAAWPAGMTALTLLVLRDNPNLCGALPGTWVINNPVVTSGSSLGTPCPSPPSPPPAPPSPFPPSPAPPSPLPPSPPPPSSGNALADLRLTVSAWPVTMLGWNTTSDPCTAAWTGVSCTAGQPTSVSLPFQGLNGSLPSTWGFVTSLQSVVLGGGTNTLRGTLHAAWSSLLALTRLDIVAQGFSGQLPPEWSLLTALRNLGLSANQLTSSVPSAWSALTALTRVELSNNTLMCGPVPSAAYIYNNTLIPGPCPSPPPPPSPPVPPSPFPPLPPPPPSPAPPSPEPPCPVPPSPVPPSPEPPVPPSPAPPVPPSPVPPSPVPPSPAPPSPMPPAPPSYADALFAVKSELLNHTVLANWTLGTHPCINGWTGVQCTGTDVTGISLQYVSPVFAAPVPRLLYQVPTLRVINFVGSGLTGTLPPEWSMLTNLVSIQLTAPNSIQGALPVGYSALALLSSLNLAGNQLTSTIPPQYSVLTALTRLTVASNAAMCGPLPPVISAKVVATSTNVGLPCPAPPLPPSPPPQPPSPPSPFPPLPPAPPSAQPVLLLVKQAVTSPWPYTDWVAGTEPCAAGATWNGVTCVGGLVEQLDLSYLNLAGTLARDLLFLTSLKYLDASVNQFGGALPWDYANLNQLSVLRLGNNSFAGYMPPEWSALTNLIELDLRGNQLISTIPPSWSTLTKLTRLDLSGNPLACGAAPPAIAAVVVPNTLANCPPPPFPPSPAPPSPLPPSPLPPVPPSPAPPVPPSPAPPSPEPPSPEPPSPAPPSPDPPSPLPPSPVPPSPAPPSPVPPSPMPPSPPPPSPFPPTPPSPVPPSPPPPTPPSPPPSPEPPSPAPPSPVPPSPAPPAPPAPPPSPPSPPSPAPPDPPSPSPPPSPNPPSPPPRIPPSPPPEPPPSPPPFPPEAVRPTISMFVSFPGMDCNELNNDPFLEQQVNNDIRTALAASLGVDSSSVAILQMVCGSSGGGGVTATGTTVRRRQLLAAALEAAAAAAVEAGASEAPPPRPNSGAPAPDEDRLLLISSTADSASVSSSSSSSSAGGAASYEDYVYTEMEALMQAPEPRVLMAQQAYASAAGITSDPASARDGQAPAPYAAATGIAVFDECSDEPPGQCGPRLPQADAADGAAGPQPSPGAGADPDHWQRAGRPAPGGAAAGAAGARGGRRWRRRMAAVANPSGVTMELAVMLPKTATQASIDLLMAKINAAPEDVTWLFSASSLLPQYGTPRVSAVAFDVRASLFSDSRPCDKRPAMAGYAPAFVSRYEFAVLLRFSAPFNFTACGANYGCVLGVSKRGLVAEGSLRPLDAQGATYRLKVTVLTEGTLELVLRDDPCDPTTRAAYLNVTADFTNPQATLALATAPTMSNATFLVHADFTEPVLPILPSDIAAIDCRIAGIQLLSPTRMLLVVEGQTGATAKIQLSSFAFADRSGNPGVPSNRLEVVVPSQAVALAAGISHYGTMAVLGASALSCGATALLAPGWRSIACVGGLLRSLGHLQVLSYTESLAFRTPAAYQKAASASEWSQLAWLPASATSWSESFSKRLGRLASAVPPPPPPRLQSLSGTLETAIVDSGLVSATPYLTYAAVAAPNATDVQAVSALMRYADGLVYNTTQLPDVRPPVREAWCDIVATAIVSGAVLAAAVLVHLVLVCSTDRDMRLLGYSFYAAWPKLLLIGLAAVTPPLVYGAFRVLSYETVGGASPPIAVFLLLALAVGAALLVVAWLMIVALTRAADKLPVPLEKPDPQWAEGTPRSRGAAAGTPRTPQNRVVPAPMSPPPQGGAQNILVNQQQQQQQQQQQLQPGMAPQDPNQLFMPRGTPMAAGRPMPMAMQAAPLPLMEMEPLPPAMPGAMLPPPPVPWQMPIRPPQLVGYVPQYATGPRPAPILMPAPPYAPLPPPAAPPPVAPQPLLTSLFGRWRGRPAAPQQPQDAAGAAAAAAPLAEALEQQAPQEQQQQAAQEGGSRRQLLRNRSKSWSSRSPRSPATAGPVGEAAESGAPAAGSTSPTEPAVGSKRRPAPLDDHESGGDAEGVSDDDGGDNATLQGLRTDSARRAAAIERLSPRGLAARQARSSCPGPSLLGSTSVTLGEGAAAAPVAAPPPVAATGAAAQSSGGDTGSPRSPRVRQPVLTMVRPGSSGGDTSPASGSAPAAAAAPGGAAYMPNAPMLLGGATARALASSRARVSMSQELGAGSGPASRLAEILATPPRRSGASAHGSDAGGSAGPSRLRTEALSQPAPRGRFSMLPPLPPSHGRNTSSARSEASIDDAMTSARVGAARSSTGPAGASGAGGVEGTSGGGARSSAGNTTWFDIASDDELVRRRTTDMDLGSGSEGGTGTGGERGSGGSRAAARRAGPGPVAEGREGNLFALDRDPEGRAKRVSKIRQARRAPEAPLVNRPITGYIPGVRGGGGGQAGPGGAGNAAAMAAAAAAGQGEWPGLAPRGDTADGGLANWLRPPPGARRDRGPARGRRSRSRGRNDDGGGGGGGYDNRVDTAASGDYGRGRSAGRLNTAGSGNYESGPGGAPTHDGRSAFCASYGWLVADVVGNTDESALSRGGQRRYLVANVVSLLRTLLLAGLLGGWAARTAAGSMLQVIAVIAVNAGWLQYLLAVRPYVSILGLVAEAVVSGLECVLLVLAALAQGRVRMSPSPATLAIVTLFIALGVVVALELVRTVLVTIYIVKRMQQAADDADEASAGGTGKGGRARSSRVGAFRTSTSGARRGGEP